MKKLVLITALMLFGVMANAQEKLYLVFEFMKVDNEQENAYADTEAFWEKIHEQRVKNGDIIGWDLWALGPGGENQGFQYLTVTLFNDPVKMFEGEGFEEALNAAYPNMSEQALDEKFNETSKSRDLAVRIFANEIANTSPEFDMPLGCVAQIDLMKVDLNDYYKYEKAEKEVFQPLHQKAVDDGTKANWGLIRFMSPIGSDTYASHMTVSMFKDIKQMLNQNIDFNEGNTPAQTKAMNDGIALRDMKYVYTARLIRKVR